MYKIWQTFETSRIKSKCQEATTKKCVPLNRRGRRTSKLFIGISMESESWSFDNKGIQKMYISILICLLISNYKLKTNIKIMSNTFLLSREKNKNAFSNKFVIFMIVSIFLFGLWKITVRKEKKKHSHLVILIISPHYRIYQLR